MTTSTFPEIRTALIQDIVRLAREKYVYPERGDRIASQLLAKLESGEYDDVAQENDLAFRLTMDLQSIANDLHWSVIYDPNGAEVDPEKEADPERLARYQEASRRENYGFVRVERLQGNVGYIDVRFFYPAEYGGETAVAAMSFVAHCDALIIDLRQHHGGYPCMEMLLISYLCAPEPRHVYSFYYRPTNDTQQFWTFPHLPGRRLTDIPVYLLTSHETGSGGESFAHNLRCMERATLVGETTKGLAHPVTKEVVQRVFSVNVPYGRPINHVTGTDWERTGVEPHIAAPAAEALKTAHLLAMRHLAEKCQDEKERSDLAWAADTIAGDYAPVVLNEAQLSRCAGEYGRRRFFIQNGALLYGNTAYPETYPLVPLAENRFRLDDDIKFEFVLAPDDRATAVKISYRDGRPESFAVRTE